MQHFWSLQNLDLQGVWLTIGSFDGVHVGHQAILNQLIAGAHEAGAPAVVLTFHPHPAEVLRHRRRLHFLSTPEGKAAMLADLGVDIVIHHPFNLRVAKMTAREFIELLSQRLGMRRIRVGDDFALGRGREGTIPVLRQLGREFGYEVEIVEPVRLDNRIVSSSWVRQSLAEGDIVTVARLLGRSYQVSGEVVRGEARGRQLGFRTANLEIWSERALPKAGVYAGWASYSNERRPAVANVGYRPTFEDQSVLPRVEVHILDFEGELYHREVSFSFIERLRDEKRFETIQELIEQVQSDIHRARLILAGEE